MSQPSSRPRPINKAERAKMAKEIINQRVPTLLSANSRAAKGVQNAIMFRGQSDLPALSNPAPVPGPDPDPSTSTEHKPLAIKLIFGDTFDVAHRYRILNRSRKIAVLNMGSVSSPGGGVLRGSLAQEEALCMRSTLYASLQAQWYRWPADGVAYAEDVLVFGAFESDGRVRMLEPRDTRWFVDVVTCAAVKHPEVRHGDNADAHGGVGEGGPTWADPRDEECMALKIKYILCACVKMRARVVVLGAFGCGAYGNPTRRVAALMRKCLVGRDGYGPKENWARHGIEEVVFAILDREQDKRVWRPFAEEFADVPGVVIEPAAS